MTADGTAGESRLAPEQEIDFVPQADSISVETVINMLVQKGICTVEELFMLEGKIRDKNTQDSRTHYIRVKNDSEHSGSDRFRWLKRLFSKYRWTRRLGTKLFGWKWRKTKRSQHDFSHNIEE